MGDANFPGRRGEESSQTVAVRGGGEVTRRISAQILSGLGEGGQHGLALWLCWKFRRWWVVD